MIQIFQSKKHGRVDVYECQADSFENFFLNELKEVSNLNYIMENIEKDDQIIFIFDNLLTEMEKTVNSKII